MTDEHEHGHHHGHGHEPGHGHGHGHHHGHESGHRPGHEPAPGFPRRTLLIAGLAAAVAAGGIAAYLLTEDDGGGTPDGGTGGSAGPTAGGAFHPSFGPDGLVTNEYAFRSPKAENAHNSPDWVVTSGSLFARASCGWTGVPDGQSPGPDSSPHTGSSVFRLVTRRRDFADCTVRTDIRLQPPGTTTRTSSVDWDGAHLWMRYRSPEQLYALSFRRRDGVVAIKRKTPDPNGAGAPGEQGAYVTLAEGKSAFGYREWHTVTGTATDQADGTVRLMLAIDGKTVLDVVDKAPERITGPGGVGIRGDNTDLDFRNFTAGPPTDH
ncbi:hypothetical protein GCM10009760_19400 [Kitasatospora kazusensis]|uniref:Concanavalin A-like lectin/glucanase superfamily protein n=1 Tax=Kitasatospora kazusensis TaxID=407974 RepID=A0ABN2Z7Z4_9ACTN